MARLTAGVPLDNPGPVGRSSIPYPQTLLRDALIGLINVKADYVFVFIGLKPQIPCSLTFFVRLNCAIAVASIRPLPIATVATNNQKGCIINSLWIRFSSGLAPGYYSGATVDFHSPGLAAGRGNYPI